MTGEKGGGRTNREGEAGFTYLFQQGGGIGAPSDDVKKKRKGIRKNRKVG